MKKIEIESLFLKRNLNLISAPFLDAKDSQILSRIIGLIRESPDEELYPSLLLSLLRCPREFKKIRSVAHVSRLILSEYFFKKKVLTGIDQQPQKRHLFLKLLKTRLEYPFGSKSVLGMVVAFNLLKQREAFEELHIIEAFRRILSPISAVKGSFLEYQDKKNQCQIVYLEVEREDDVDFTREDIELLQQDLPNELQGCIEQLVPMTFMRRNEEEVYRNILVLRDELKGTKDIPQATITFEEQTQFDLFFTVVLLRLVKGNVPSIKELFERANPDIVFILDRVDNVGKVRKSYLKEATVFRLQLSKSQFYRKDRSVNLYKARHKVVSMLMKALGPIRDFNGGLILKQNEKLEDFLALMPQVNDEFLLENFFYSINPIVMQSILPAYLIKEWFLVFSKLMEQELSKEHPFLIEYSYFEDAVLCIVRAEDFSFKTDVLAAINDLNIPSLELAFSELNSNGVCCFGFLYRPSLIERMETFCDVIHHQLHLWAAKKHQEQTIRICLRGSHEPSLDPRITKSDQSHVIIKMLYEGLMRMGLDGKLSPAMAESYEISEDHKRYTFHLRSTFWSNGAPITAYDFEYTWKKALHPSAHSVYSNTFFIIKNAKLAKENKISLDEVGIKAVNHKTLVVELEHPADYFLDLTAHWSYALINSHIDRKYPGWAYQAGDTYVCNGPFKLADWKHQRTITVVKNPYYWDKESVKLDQISIAMIDSTQQELRMFEHDEIDFLGRPLSSSPITHFYSRNGIEKVTYPLEGNFVLWLNTKTFPFNNKKMRQAFACAIHRESLPTHVLAHEFKYVSGSLLPEELSLHDYPLFPKHDLDIARQLFQEGLKELGISSLSKLTICYCSGMYREELFKLLCQQWKEAFDIELVSESHEWNVHFKRLVSGDFQIGGMELHALWKDPTHILEYFKTSADLFNISRWEHSQYAKFLDLANASLNVQERREFLKKAEKFLMEELPAIPLYQIYGNYLKKSCLKNIYTSPYFDIDFKWAYKEKTHENSSIDAFHSIFNSLS